MDYVEKHEPSFSKLTVPSDYILSTTDIRRYYEETIKEFPELFADKLPLDEIFRRKVIQNSFYSKEGLSML